MLSVRDLVVRYGRAIAIDGVSLDVEEGEFVSVVGPNGAGKSTLLLALGAVLEPYAGSIEFRGRSTRGCRPERLVRDGLALVPEGRHIFATLTVEENLRLGATTRRDRQGVGDDLDRVFGMFPILESYRRTMAGKLSGGEQQMLAIGRALLSRPRVLMLDEPSLGLAPRVVDQVFDVIAELNASGTTVLLVEQNALRAASAADRTYVLRNGRVALSATRKEFVERSAIQEEVLGL